MSETTKRILVVVDVDPAVSDRAVEALRMSVGLAAAGNDVTIRLRGGAGALAGPDRDRLPGGNRAAAFLDALERLGARVETSDSEVLDDAVFAIRWTAGDGERELVLGDPGPTGKTRLPLEGDPDIEDLLDRILASERVVVW